MRQLEGGRPRRTKCGSGLLSMQIDVSVVSTLVGVLSADWKGRRECGESPDASRVERKISHP